MELAAVSRSMFCFSRRFSLADHVTRELLGARSPRFQSLRLRLALAILRASGWDLISEEIVRAHGKPLSGPRRSTWFSWRPKRDSEREKVEKTRSKVTSGGDFRSIFPVFPKISPLLGWQG